MQKNKCAENELKKSKKVESSEDLTKQSDSYSSLTLLPSIYATTLDRSAQKSSENGLLNVKKSKSVYRNRHQRALQTYQQFRTTKFYQILRLEEHRTIIQWTGPGKFEFSLATYRGTSQLHRRSTSQHNNNNNNNKRYAFYDVTYQSIYIDIAHRSPPRVNTKYAQSKLLMSGDIETNPGPDNGVVSSFKRCLAVATINVNGVSQGQEET